MAAPSQSKTQRCLLGSGLTGAEFSFCPLERTILPRTSVPAVLMFPAASMALVDTAWQSTSTLALVLLITT